MKIKKITTGILEENCYILSENNTCLVIDPGSDYPKIKEAIEKDKVLAILITHMHFDHIGALEELLQENDSIIMYKKSCVENNQEISIGDFHFRTIYTPGHSSDSITFYFEKEKTMFTGDFIFKDTVGRCDLPTGDHNEMNESLKKIIKYDENIILYPGHGEETTIKQEKKFNFYLQQIK